MDDTLKNSFNPSLPLPADDEMPAKQDYSQEPAVELIRKKVAAAYAAEPDLVAEEQNLGKASSAARPSKHRQFIYELTSAKKPLKDLQKEWHEYYIGLSDLEKHQVWQEFYNLHAEASHFTDAVPSMAPAGEAKPRILNKPTHGRTPADRRKPLLGTSLAADAPEVFLSRTRAHLKSLLFGLATGGVVILILMFGFFNERFIAPFIQPSRNSSNVPLIDASVISDAPELIVPKINLEVPVVYGVNTVNDEAVQNALESGVVHYADTADPGQDGNLVIVGHSSNNILNPGKYKFAFVLLHDLQPGDTFYIQKDGKRYTYQVYERKVVSPTDVSVLGPADKPATASLITCDPPGTSNNRLVIIGQQISPDPASNIASTSQNTLATSVPVIPGNSQSLWSRIWGWF